MCIAFEESHTRMNVSVKIKSVIIEWGLDKKVLHSH